MLSPIRQLKRDWKSGEIKLLFFTLFFAISSISFINLFSYRLDQGIYYQGGTFLGADLIWSSPRKPANNILDYARQQQLNTSQSVAFTTALMANDEFMLAHIKAVDKHYPLLGQIEIIQQGKKSQTKYGPASGEVWLAEQIVNQLGLKIGDSIQVGHYALKITARLIHDPGQVNSFLSFAPKALININDMKATGIIRPGSRVSFQTAFSGNKVQVSEFEQWLKQQVHSSDKLIGGQHHNTSINKALSKTREILSLANILSLILSGIAIAMCTRLFLLRHEKQTAIMRCIGASQKSILSLYLFELLLLAIPTSILALISGYFIEYSLVSQLSHLLPERVLTIQTPSILKAQSTALLTGLLTLLLFSLPAFYSLLKMPANHIFRQTQSNRKDQTIATLLISFCYLFLLSAWQTGQWKLSLLLSAALLGILLFFFILASILLRFSRYLRPLFRGAGKLGIQQFSAHYRSNSYLIFSISLCLVILLGFFQVKSTLLQQWQNKLSDTTPNYFLINISQAELPAIKDFFQSNQIQSRGIFPMVRGRIETINNIPIDKLFPHTEKRDNSLRRELNLSWNATLPYSNRITQGVWHAPVDKSKSDKGLLTVSMETGVAKRLGLDLNDQLSLSIGDRTISAQITSLRSLEWDSFQPNFYLIFSPGALDDFSANYISSFYLAPEQSKSVVELLEQFPAVTVLDMNSLIRQVQSTLSQLVVLLEYLFLFLVASSLFVIIASLLSSQDERKASSQLMLTLGASNRFVNRCQRNEYLWIGFATLILCAIGGLSLNAILDYYFFTR